MNLVINGNNLIGFDDRDESKKILTEMGYSDAQIEEAISEAMTNDLFLSEKSIAWKIMSDYQLGLYSITEQDITDTRLYIQSIEPLAVASNQRAAIPRPLIFSRYKRNPYEL